MCGNKLKGSRWFVGGPKSAFSIIGAYYDPPMHEECAHYALQVCPYLAAPTYSRRIEDKTINPSGGTIMAEHAVDQQIARLSVRRGRATGQTLRDNLIIPKTPFTKIEYWMHGTQLSQAEGEELCKAEMK